MPLSAGQLKGYTVGVLTGATEVDADVAIAEEARVMELDVLVVEAENRAGADVCRALLADTDVEVAALADAGNETAPAILAAPFEAPLYMKAPLKAFG